MQKNFENRFSKQDYYLSELAGNLSIFLKKYGNTR